ncbi:hypothetical protein CQW23_33182 [Capsicum baccatum]|uniref:non-specific serine/threonine protein kinase n=1 Tax=Capsicum baccatum TaxID=33114 RepID=A0A2G2V2L6_CAPBA|nr:hypothetical protein CQW23_33182 [Capsicum baccatum]
MDTRRMFAGRRRKLKTNLVLMVRQIRGNLNKLLQNGCNKEGNAAGQSNKSTKIRGCASNREVKSGSNDKSNQSKANWNRGLDHSKKECWPKQFITKFFLPHHPTGKDISSSNVLLDSEFEARVSDFGIAKILKPNSSNCTTLAGTYGYVAPGGHGFKHWKQPLVEIQVKAACDTSLWWGLLRTPRIAGPLVHRATLLEGEPWSNW